jgi:hypothetical protein
MKSIKEGFNKYLKGMFGIFVIKMCVIVVILINQACEKEEFLPQENAKQNFLEALQVSRDRIANIESNISLNKLDFFNRSMEIVGVLDVRDSLTVICTNEPMHKDGDEEDQELDLIPLTLADMSTVHLGTKEDFLNDEEYCYSFYNWEAEEALEPVVSEARSFLHERGMTDAEIDNMIATEGGTEEDLVATVALIIEDENARDIVNVNFESLFINLAYGQSWGDVGRCAAAAIGVDAIYALSSGTGGEKWKKKAIKKLFKKVAARFLGPVGIAIAVIEFAVCVAQAT